MINSYSIKQIFWTKRIKIQALLLSAICLVFLTAVIINNSDYWLFSTLILLPTIYFFDKISITKEDSTIFFDKRLVFDVDKVCIGDNTFSVDTKTKLIFHLNDWDNKPNYAGRRISYFNGIDNYCQIFYDKEEISFQFYIDSEIQFDNLISMFKIWYNNGIDLTEKNGSGDTLLLNQVTNYLEISKVKRPR